MPQKALRFSLAALEVEAVQSTSSDWQRVLAATHTLIVGQGGGTVTCEIVNRVTHLVGYNPQLT